MKIYQKWAQILHFKIQIITKKMVENRIDSLKIYIFYAKIINLQNCKIHKLTIPKNK